MWEAPDGEDWSDYLKRSADKVKKPDQPAELFETFRTTADITEAAASFAHLFALSSASDVYPWSPEPHDAERYFPYMSIRKTAHNWKAKELWKKLDSRCSRAEYASDSPCVMQNRQKQRRCLVVGAGPCGLRAAIELRLLGFSVTIVDSREEFSRINQLHLWEWVMPELVQLGAKILEPPPNSFGANPDKLSIEIGHLQTFLFKIALLLGVQVFLGTELQQCGWSDNMWKATLHRSSTVVQPMAQAPSEICVAALVDAAGLKSKINNILSLPEKEVVEHSEAIGLVCNFQRSHGENEKRLRPFSMARQFFPKAFAKLQEETGAELENIVYIMGESSHYFVMTPTRRSLIATGVVASDEVAIDRNYDKTKLDALVRKIAIFDFPIQDEDQPPVYAALSKDFQGETPQYVDHGPSLFDFSNQIRSLEGFEFIPPAAPDVHDEQSLCALYSEQSLLAASVGDSLIEPFWPEGLGITRGFLGVWDVCSAMSEWGAGGDPSYVLRHFRALYTELKMVSRNMEKAILHNHTSTKAELTYMLAPQTRYRQFHPEPGGVAMSRPQCRSDSALPCLDSDASLGGEGSRFSAKAHSAGEIVFADEDSGTKSREALNGKAASRISQWKEHLRKTCTENKLVRETSPVAKPPSCSGPSQADHRVSSHVGYLWIIGDRLCFRWSAEPVDGAVATVTPAPIVRGWEFKAATMDMKVGVNDEKALFVGFSNFFRFARKKGVTVTLLKPVVKIVLYYSDGEPLKFVEVGQSFDIGSVVCAGIVHHANKKLDDLQRMTKVEYATLHQSVFDAKGEHVKLSDLPSHSPAPRASVPAAGGSQGYGASAPAKEHARRRGSAEEPLEGSSESEEEDYIKNFDSKKNIANEFYQGCYLVIEKSEASITVVRKWSKEERPAGAVAFFEPSLDKVAATSWKYDNGGRRVVLLSGAMSGDGPPAKYYDSWINYLSEARKMDGKIELLPSEDPILAAQVVFQRSEDPTIIHAKVGEAVTMSEQAMAAVVPADTKTFDVSEMHCGMFMSEGRKLGSIISWA